MTFSSCITITEPKKEAILTLTSQSSSDLMNRLLSILEDFQCWQDVLSRELFQWGSEVIGLADLVEGTDISKLQEVANSHLDELQKEILLDPLTQRPFQTPVLASDWTWEEEVLQSYALVYSRPTVVKTHEFAVAMLNWLQDVRGLEEFERINCNLIEAAEQDPEKALREVSNEKLSLKERQAWWRCLVRNGRHLKDEKALQRALQLGNEKFKAAAEAMKNAYERDAARLQAQIEHAEAEINQRIEGIEALSQERVDLLKDQVKNLRTELTENQENIRRINGRLAEKGAEIRKLTAQREECLREINNLRSRLGKQKGCVIL